jgi:ABC-type glycerol-3-phosphate transport system permease component
MSIAGAALSWLLRRLPSRYMVALDYPVESTPRYGFGRPPHAELWAWFDGHREAFQSCIARAATYRGDLESIPLEPRPDLELPLVNTLTALILVYTAQGLPLSIFILSEFMKQVSDDLKNAGRIDGLSEYTIFFRLVLPLVRPSMATVAVFTMIPIWNDLWFPLILSPNNKTITLGAQVFIGQYVTNWNAVLSALSLAMLPVLILYLICSRQLIRGITSGAVK